MSDESLEKIIYKFDRERSLAGGRFAGRRLTPSVKKAWVGLLALIVVGYSVDSLPLPDFFHLPGAYSRLIEFLWIVVVMIAAALITPRLARRFALSDFRRREPDGFEVSVVRLVDGLEISWKKSVFRFGWADVTELMIGAGQLIIIHGAALSFPMPMTSFADDNALRAFIRACAAELTPEAMERSGVAIGPYLT